MTGDRVDVLAAALAGPVWPHLDHHQRRPHRARASEVLVDVDAAVAIDDVVDVEIIDETSRNYVAGYAAGLEAGPSWRALRGHIADAEAERWVSGQMRVQAVAAHDRRLPLHVGTARAFSMGTQVLIETDDGDRVWWRTNLVEPTGDQPARALKVGDPVTTKQELEDLPIGAVLSTRRHGAHVAVRVDYAPLTCSWEITGTDGVVCGPEHVTLLPATVLALPGGES